MRMLFIILRIIRISKAFTDVALIEEASLTMDQTIAKRKESLPTAYLTEDRLAEFLEKERLL